MLCTDAIEWEDGSYSAQPMRLPTVNGDNYYLWRFLCQMWYICALEGRHVPYWFLLCDVMCVCVCSGFACLLSKTDDRRMTLSALFNYEKGSVHQIFKIRLRRLVVFSDVSNLFRSNCSDSN